MVDLGWTLEPCQTPNLMFSLFSSLCNDFAAGAKGIISPLLLSVNSKHFQNAALSQKILRALRPKKYCVTKGIRSVPPRPAVGKSKSRSHFSADCYVPQAVLDVKGLREGKTSLRVASWLAFITWARR